MLKWIGPGAIAILVVGCTTTTPEVRPVRNKTPHTPTTWRASHAIQPGPALLQWIQGRAKADDGRRRTLRLPVAIRRPRGGTGARAAAISGTAELPADAVLLTLDDGALGISLAERLRAACGAATHCVVWLEGRWGPLLHGLEPPRTGSPWTFAVMHFDRVVTDADRRAGVKAQSD